MTYFDSFNVTMHCKRVVGKCKNCLVPENIHLHIAMGFFANFHNFIKIFLSFTCQFVQVFSLTVGGNSGNYIYEDLKHCFVERVAFKEECPPIINVS